VDARPVAVRWSSPGTAPRRASLDSVRDGRLGLFTAIARPGRLVDALRAEGARLDEVVSVSDHGPVTPGARARLLGADVDAWLATEKCALHLGGIPLGRRLGVLEAGVTLPSAVETALRDLVS
jgi:tetraacyldisaccharide-1-P 4'-kinase